MSPREANIVLAKAGQYDGRKADPDTATEWATALKGLRLEDCIEAVRWYYANGDGRWVMPKDIRRHVNIIRQDRIERGRGFLVPPDFPENLTDEQHTLAYQDWETSALRALADGQPPNLAQRQLSPDMPSDVAAIRKALRPPAKPNAEQESA